MESEILYLTPYTKINLKRAIMDTNWKSNTIKVSLKENKGHYFKTLGQARCLQEDTKSRIHKKKVIY